MRDPQHTRVDFGGAETAQVWKVRITLRICSYDGKEQSHVSALVNGHVYWRGRQHTRVEWNLLVWKVRMTLRICTHERKEQNRGILNHTRGKHK